LELSTFPADSHNYLLSFLFHSAQNRYGRASLLIQKKQNNNELSSRLFCAKRLRGDFLSDGQLSFGLSSFYLSDCDDFGVEQDRLKFSMCAPLRRLQQKKEWRMFW
jgi:hypothetical protein